MRSARLNFLPARNSGCFRSAITTREDLNSTSAAKSSATSDGAQRVSATSSVLSRSACSSASLSPTTMWYLIPGYLRTRCPMISETTAVTGSVVPILTIPCAGSDLCTMSITPCLISSKATCVRSTRRRPHSVNSTPREDRSSSAVPMVCSMSAMALEIAGCDNPRCFDALAMLPISAMVWSVWRSLSLRRRPMRSSHCICIHHRL